MKRLVALSLLATSALGVAQEKEHKHYFAPKYFYRHHNEEGYVYRTHGAGIEYNLWKPEGINIKISGMTNGKHSQAFVEGEQYLWFKIPLHENHVLYPILGSRVCSHQRGGHEDKLFFINKNTGFAGIGWEIIPHESVRIKIESNYFRDLHNSILAQQEDNFWGKSYSNPFGFRWKIGVDAHWKENAFINLDAYYARTWRACYEEVGIEAAFKWGF